MPAGGLATATLMGAGTSAAPMAGASLGAGSLGGGLASAGAVPAASSILGPTGMIMGGGSPAATGATLAGTGAPGTGGLGGGMPGGGGQGGGLGDMITGIKEKSPVRKIVQGALTGALGAGQLISGIIKRRKGEAAMPSLVDPQQQSFLNKVRRQQKLLRSGTAFEPTRAALSREAATTGRGILRASGGASGAAIAGLTRTQRAIGRGIGELGQKSLQEQTRLTALEDSAIQGIAQRKMELQLLKRAQFMAESAQLKKESAANIGALLASITPIEETTASQAVETTT